MGTNTGLGIGIGIPFKNNALGGDKPYFPPELKARIIGVWTNYGKKNTDTDRNIIKNKIPNAGGDLEILNAAYKLNSGFGEYSEDFTTWTKSSKITSVDSESFDFVTNVNWNLLYYKSNIGKDIPSFKVRIKLKGEGKVFYNYITSEGVYTNEAITSEEYVTPISYNTKYTGETPVNCGFSIGITSEEGSGTITQIPNFEDAFVTDGINDMIVSQKTLQEMGVTKELTIVSMIHQISWRGSASVPLTNYIRPKTNEYVRSHVSNIGKTGIYGYVCYDISNSGAGNSHVVNTILGDKNDYSINIVGDLSQGKFSVQGYIDDNGNILETSSVAHYWTFAVLGKATEDEINLIIGNYNLDRSLKPDILCNIGKQGITNDNHADFNDKLIDYSGNGRDIQLNNLAWKGGSGIAAKQGESIKDYSIIKDEEYQELTIYNEFKFKIKSKLSGRYWTVQYINRTNTSYPVTIVIDKDAYWVNSTTYYDADNNKQVIRKDIPIAADTPIDVLCCGYDQFDIPEDATSIVSAVSYINYNAVGEITVELIPSCEGGLITDGVNDFGKVTGLPAYKDYTTIIDYQRFDIGYIEGKGTAGILSKAHAAGQGAFFMNLIGRTGTHMNSYSFGTANANTYTDLDRQIYYQTKYKMQGFDMTAGTGVDGDSMWLALVRDNDSRFFNGVFYSLLMFPYSMSEFLIERQLKKYELGTLYPGMVEFRPIVKSNNKWDIIEIWQGDKSLYRPAVNDDKTGIYLKKDSTISIYVKPYVGQKVSEIVYNGVSYTDLKLNSNGFYYKVVPITKSPQKITMTIEQDENYVKFEPVITSNVEYVRLDFYLNNYQKRINIGDYIPKDAYLRANLYLKNNVDELTVFTFNGVNIGYRRSSVDDTAFNINPIYNYDSPQEVNITIDEYIRYEDIVQPYPVLLRFKDENGNEVSWGGKFKVGSTITRIGSITDPESNLLNGLYSISGLSLNGKAVTSSTSIVEKQMVFKTTATYLLDNNEPKCILSPSRLRIPNSSYKLLGYIPDISGHGNHGVIHNSAYAEGSGVNEDGSYQFDGVDDYITIPTTVGGKQMLMKVNWQSIAGTAILYDQRTNGGFAIFNRDFDTNENKVPAYRARNIGGSTYIDGILNKYIYASELKNITHNIVELHDPKLNIGTLNPKIGSSFLNSNYTQMSLYDFMLFDEISTDDKIKELNEYVGIEAKVEKMPYYWDAYGKTNLDVDRGIVPQLGIAKDYSFASFDNEMAWYLIPNNYINVVSRNGYEITLKNLSTGVNGWRFQNSTVKGFISHDIPFRIKANKSIRVYWDMHSYKISTGAEFGEVISITNVSPNKDTYINLRHLTEEELAKLDTNKDRMYYILWFDLSTIAVNEEVVIEMLPVEGGRNLWLNNYNFAYDKMSGFGGYEFDKFTNTSRWIETKRENGIEVIEKNDYSFTAKRVGTGEYFWDFKNNSIRTLDKELTVKAVSNNNVSIRWEFKYRTAEKPDIDSTIVLVKQAMTPNVPITVTLPYKTEEEQAELGVIEGSTYYLFYFDPSDIPVNEEYTVEMLPLYPNGLVYDAVTDYSKNSDIPALDDFTAIMKRKWLKKQGCPLIKGSKVYEGGNGNALLFEWDKAYNFVFYKRTDIIEGELPDNISFITPTNYNGNVITRGSEQDTNGICIAGDGNAGFANMVFYKLILYPKTIPLLQINFLKNLMERDEIIDLTNPIFIKNE